MLLWLAGNACALAVGGRHPSIRLARTSAISSSAQSASLSQKFAEFPRTWVPFASTFELIPDKPTPVRFLDQSYVAFQDNDGEWRLMDDSCPHRLAPLSEGRIDREMNRIECAYHGWAFEPSSGACARIPANSGCGLRGL